MIPCIRQFFTIKNQFFSIRFVKNFGPYELKSIAPILAKVEHCRKNAQMNKTPNKN